MAKRIPEPSGRKLDRKLHQKLDGGLRRLLLMTDDEILKAVKTDQARLKKNLKELPVAGAKKRSPRAATGKGKKLPARLDLTRRMLLYPHPVFGVVMVDKRHPKPIRVRAITRFTGNRDDLAALGIEVHAQSQDIFTITATPKELLDLAAQSATRSLRLPRLLIPSVEQASAQGEVAAVHDPRPVNPTGYEGQGVIVGLIDSPLDVTHHGFRDPAGTHDSRVLYYWVQTPDSAAAPGQNPEQFHQANLAGTPDFTGLNYGRIYTRAQITTANGLAGGAFGNGASQISRAPLNREHGTHTTGIAAGSGHENAWGTAPTHIGAAPQATIIHVCRRITNANIQSGTYEDDLVNGIDFIFRAAAFHNMPAVVSVSLGTNLGPHNGASEFDDARDNLLNSFFDRSIVWAAGNDNSWNGYRQGTINIGATETLTFTPLDMDPPFDPARDRWLDVWYSGPELEFEIQRGAATSGWITAGNEFHGNLGGFAIDMDREVEAGGGFRSLRLYIMGAQNASPWTVRLRNPSATQTVDYHAWTGLQGWCASLNGASRDELTLSDTACGKSILTVGASAKVIPPNPATGELIADYSGAGPTLDGRIKPEIVAVGGTSANQIQSANSNQASGYTTMNGTSMATPLVAGAVALLFEAYNAQGHTLNQDTIKALLVQNANRLNLHLDPSQAGYVAVERNQYGYGRLRMIAPIDQVQPPMNVDVWVRTADDDYGLEPYPGGCFCGSPDIRVFQAGTNNQITQLNWGTTYDVKVTVRNLGDSNAVGTTVRLKYTLPWAAPNDWHAAEDASDNALEATVDVPALGQVEVPFSWRPQAAEIGAPAADTHFCLLAELNHALDPLVYSAPAAGGGSAWSTNIKGTNNVALRNLHIQ